MNKLISKRIMNKGAKTLSLGILIALLAPAIASACPHGGGMGRMQPGTEIADTWLLQAEYASDRMELSADEGKQLSEIYVAARTSFIDSIHKNRPGKGHCRGKGKFGPEFREKMQERHRILNSARLDAIEEFEKSTVEILDDQKAAEAVELLGFFTPGWDRLVGSLSEMDMEDEVFTEAMDMVAGFVAENSMLFNDTDPSSMRAKCMERKIELDLQMATIFTDEQLEEWKSNTKPGGFCHKSGKGRHPHHGEKGHCFGK